MDIHLDEHTDGHTEIVTSKEPLIVVTTRDLKKDYVQRLCRFRRHTT